MPVVWGEKTGKTDKCNTKSPKSDRLRPAGGDSMIKIQATEKQILQLLSVDVHSYIKILITSGFSTDCFF